MRNKILSGVMTVFGLLLVAVPSFAHHSFTAEFDMKQPVVFCVIRRQRGELTPRS